MIILSIETSCDDTGVAILEKSEKGIRTLASIVSSQDEIHKKWGGVYPSEAKREHQKNLVPTLKEALKKAGLLEKGKTTIPENLESFFEKEKLLHEDLCDFLQGHSLKGKIDKIAVTVGPGLEPCLWVGINFAKALALCLGTPIVPVNHIKAHILFFLLDRKKIHFPAVSLIVSGGHTEIILMESLYSFSLIGKTRDDAAGECFDKAARILGLGYPGGPAIAEKANKKRVQREKTPSKKEKIFSIDLPRPMMKARNYDLSFSGLKTAVLYDHLKRSEKIKREEEYIMEMSEEIEEAITDVLVSKLEKAIKEYDARTLLLGGGVTANRTLQKKVKALKEKFPELAIILPSLHLSTDNAEMVGIAATVEEERDPEIIKANANLKIYDTMASNTK